MRHPSRRSNSRVLTIAAVLFMLGCSSRTTRVENHCPNSSDDAKSRPAPAHITLSWEGYLPDQDIEATLFQIDGKSVGMGSEGFGRVIKRLCNLPIQSKVTVRRDRPSNLSAGLPYWEPYERLNLRKVLEEIMRERELRFEFRFLSGDLDDEFEFLSRDPY